MRGQKAFPVFNADRVIIRLPCGQGQLSRIWKVQCDWLSLGKECCTQLSRRLWGGTKDELPQKRLCGRLVSRRLKLRQGVCGSCFRKMSPLKPAGNEIDGI